MELTTKDAAGAVVPGVAVTITSTGNTAGFNRTVTTNGQGFAQISQLAPGSYTIVSAPISGFVGQKAEFRVELGRAAQVTLELSTTVGAVVDITGGDVPIDSTSSEISTSVSSQKIEALPKGTNFTSILKIIPGVRQESLAGGFY